MKKKRFVKRISDSFSEIFKNYPINLSVSNSNLFDPSVGDQMPIFLTNNKPGESFLNTNEIKVYNLITSRIVSTVLPPCEKVDVKIVAENNGHTFQCQLELYKSLGWRVLYQQRTKDESLISALQKLKHEATLKHESSAMVEMAPSSPPAPFTEAKIVSELIYDEKTKFFETSNRSYILDRLISSGFLEKKRRVLSVTDKGKTLINFLREANSLLISPQLNHSLEERMESLAEGRESEEEFFDFLRHTTKKIVEQIDSVDLSKPIFEAKKYKKAYFLWYDENKERFKEENKEASPLQLREFISAKWRSLKKSEKEPYLLLEKKLKEENEKSIN